MTLSECAPRQEPLDLQVASTGDESRAPDVIEELVDQLSDVIYGLASHRPDPSDGVAWLSFDAALCGLHGALVALEELIGVHRLNSCSSLVRPPRTELLSADHFRPNGSPSAGHNVRLAGG